MGDAGGGAAAPSAAGGLSTAWGSAMDTVNNAKVFQFNKGPVGGPSAPTSGASVLATYAGLLHISVDGDKLVVKCAGAPTDNGGSCQKSTTISDGQTKVATSNLLNHLRSTHKWCLAPEHAKAAPTGRLHARAGPVVLCETSPCIAAATPHAMR